MKGFVSGHPGSRWLVWDITVSCSVLPSGGTNQNFTEYGEIIGQWCQKVSSEASFFMPPWFSGLFLSEGFLLLGWNEKLQPHRPDNWIPLEQGLISSWVSNAVLFVPVVCSHGATWTHVVLLIPGWWTKTSKLHNEMQLFCKLWRYKGQSRQTRRLLLNFSKQLMDQARTLLYYSHKL